MTVVLFQSIVWLAWFAWSVSAVNRVHAYDRFLDATADRRIKTQKNWVPASCDEDLLIDKFLTVSL